MSILFSISLFEKPYILCRNKLSYRLNRLVFLQMGFIKYHVFVHKSWLLNELSTSQYYINRQFANRKEMSRNIILLSSLKNYLVYRLVLSTIRLYLSRIKPVYKLKFVNITTQNSSACAFFIIKRQAGLFFSYFSGRLHMLLTLRRTNRQNKVVNLFSKR